MGMEDFAVTIGGRIRYYRNSRNLTQDQLADLAHIDHSYVGKIERGEKNVTVILLDHILKALDVSYVEFFEPFDLKKKADSIPMTCYDLISEQPKIQQKRILRIIKEIISFMT